MPPPSPAAEFEVPLWRALAVFRLATFGYGGLLLARNLGRYDHPAAGGAVLAVMAAWTVITISAYAQPSGRRWPLLGADLVITAGCVLASRWVVGVEALETGTAATAAVWMACPVLAWAVAWGRGWGAAAAVVIGSCDLFVRGDLNQASLTGSVIMLLAGVAIGHVARVAADVQERLRLAAEREAATRERERLARGIHDSVLQVLALVQRRGAEIGGTAAELGRLAGEQEAALRALVSNQAHVEANGYLDLRAALAPHASASVSIATPAVPVWLPAHTGVELAAAVVQAVDNSLRHGRPETRVWVLLEEEHDSVTVTVRDDGPGIAPGRLAQAEADGRLGVAQSIRGRVADLGGTVTITSTPGEGTEVELRVGRYPDSRD